MKRLSILGSSGSIGKQTLEIVDENPADFSVSALAINKNIKLLAEQVEKYRPALVCVYDKAAADEFSVILKEIKSKDSDIRTELTSGMDGLIAVATVKPADIVVTAIVGMIGIRPTIAAINAGKDIALANKETLVTAGHIIIPLIKEKGVKLLPVDSEHSAIFQSLQGLPYVEGNSVHDGNPAVDKIILTASGGPFRGMKREQLVNKTKADALKHPNWTMGAKITIDSATLVNKGLEMMEAGWLFGVSCDDIEVVIHPQSILHSAVQFKDGAIIGQMGRPDMKLPILYALTYPERKYLGGKRVDFFELGSMSFERPDKETFKGLALAEEAMKTGGSMPTVFNAANEWLVGKFLADEIGFLDIARGIELAMNKHKNIATPDVETILNVQRETEELLCTHL
ncbi:MAG: 1-deoxy-D-xylulose-5-phosphate reductoisomerase [Lachnospiraceae bacterium]|nr:1-deoxy-D-xylulose-5-phosphate reductoisomerase [Lachnospiraceae bacterium]